MHDVQLATIGQLYAMATAFGSMKKEKFDKFIDTLNIGKKLKVEISELKNSGLPFEEK